MDLTSSGARVARMETSTTALPMGESTSFALLSPCSRFPSRRLPDGDKGSDHLRKIFYRMGFNDQEIGEFPPYPTKRRILTPHLVQSLSLELTLSDDATLTVLDSRDPGTSLLRP